MDSTYLYNDGEFLVRATNDMFDKLAIQEHITNWKDINSPLIVKLFEGINGETLRDVILLPKSKEDEIHNVQVVIDTISMDILHISLSHITGEDVVAANKFAIGNLIEVLAELLEFVVEDMQSRASSPTTVSSKFNMVEDPDMVTSELIDDVLQKELSKDVRPNTTDSISYSSPPQKPFESGVNSLRDIATNKSVTNTPANSTAELIALGRSSMEDISSNHLQAATAAFLNQRNPQSTMNGYFGQTEPGIRRTWPLVSQSPPSRLIESTIYGSQLPHSTSQPPHTTSLQPHTTSQQPHITSQQPHITSQQPNVSMSTKHPHCSTQLPDNRFRLPLSSFQQPQNSTRIHHSSSQLSHSTKHIAPVSFRNPMGKKPQSAFLSSIMANAESEDRSGPEVLHGGIRSDPSNSEASVASAGLHMGCAPLSKSYTHHLFHHFEEADRAGVNLRDFSSSISPPHTQSGCYTGTWDDSRKLDHATSMPIIMKVTQEAQVYKRGLAVTEQPNMLGARARSYENLDKQMQDTVDMSRAALLKSPLRNSHLMLNGSTSPDLNSSSANKMKKRSNGIENRQFADKSEGKSKPVVHPTSTPAKIRSAPASPNVISTSSISEARPYKPNRKVSFEVTRSSKSAPKKQSYSGITNQMHRPSRKSSTLRYSSRVQQKNTNTNNSIGDTTSASDAEKSESRVTRKLFTKHTHGKSNIKTQRDQPKTRDGGMYRMFLDEDPRPVRSADYSRDADISEDGGLRQINRLGTRFEVNHPGSRSSPINVDNIRLKISNDSKKIRDKANMLSRLYNMELEDYEEGLAHTIKPTRKKSSEKENEYKKKVLQKSKNGYVKPSKTSVLRPHVRLHSVPQRTKKQGVLSRKRNLYGSPALGLRKSPGNDDLLPLLLEEFPFLHLSKETLHDLWKKSSDQIEQLTKSQQEVKGKKSKAEVQFEEAQRRHEILKHIMDKEMQHNERMREMKERTYHQQNARSQVRNQREQSARARRYYDEFQVRNRSRMLKKRTREELVFKHLFKDGLKMQRDQIREMMKYEREQRSKRYEREQNHLDSIENYYRDQFVLVSEAVKKERNDLEIKDSAQAKIVNDMKRRLRQKMVREISALQEQLYRDEDEEHFRQLDADRMRQQLQLCRNQTTDWCR